MKNFILLVELLFNAVIGFVAVLFKKITVGLGFDHSGYQSFVEQTSNVALQVKLRLNHFLGLLQHSPTV